MSKKKPPKEPIEIVTKGSLVGRFDSASPPLPDATTKVPKFRQSGHFIDQKLKYNDPTKQQSLFDRLDPKIVGEVKKSEVKYEGIHLTPSEDRLIVTISGLLKDKSEHKNSDSDKFYTGNHEGAEIIPFGEENVKPAYIRLLPTELYKAYLDTDEYSGQDIKNINKTLASLCDKRFLITYDRYRVVEIKNKKETRIDRIEVFQKLISVANFTPDMTPEEAAQLDRGNDAIRETKGELIIALHPILTDQINSKYVEYPQDINRRTIIAAGGDHRNVTQAINTLRDYMMRELSAKRYTCEINRDKLPLLLKLDKYIKQGRKKLLWDTIEKAIQACKRLGLILDVIETKGAEGQAKYVFTLSKDFG